MTYKYYIQKLMWLVGILLFCAITIAPATQAATVINNVSVESSSSNGNNQSSSISVKTVVDGKVVEDYQETSATGKLFYSSQISEDDFERIIVASTSDSSANTESSRLQELVSLIEELLRLLAKVSGST